MAEGPMAGAAKVLGKMRFINPTFQGPCKCNISGNRMRYSRGANKQPSIETLIRLAELFVRL